MPASTIRVELRAVIWPVVAGVSTLAAVAGAGGVIWARGGVTLLPIAFALLAAAAAFVLDEPASEVVDVTPMGSGRWTAGRALALLVPLGVGAGLVFALALQVTRPSWPEVGVALAGSVLLGFAAACVARRRFGEPGAVSAATAVAVLVAPGLLPPLSRWIRTFPAAAPDPGGLPVAMWWGAVGAVCVAAMGAALVSPRSRG